MCGVNHEGLPGGMHHCITPEGAKHADEFGGQGPTVVRDRKPVSDGDSNIDLIFCPAARVALACAAVLQIKMIRSNGRLVAKYNSLVWSINRIPECTQSFFQEWAGIFRARLAGASPKPGLAGFGGRSRLSCLPVGVFAALARDQ